MTHAWVHMTRGMQRFGNPMRYATFLDESLKLHAAVAAACAHRAQWETSQLARRRFLVLEGAGLNSSHTRLSACRTLFAICDMLKKRWDVNGISTEFQC